LTQIPNFFKFGQRFSTLNSGAPDDMSFYHRNRGVVAENFKPEFMLFSDAALEFLFN